MSVAEINEDVQNRIYKKDLNDVEIKGMIDILRERIRFLNEEEKRNLHIEKTIKKELYDICDELERQRVSPRKYNKAYCDQRFFPTNLSTTDISQTDAEKLKADYEKSEAAVFNSAAAKFGKPYKYRFKQPGLFPVGGRTKQSRTKQSRTKQSRTKQSRTKQSRTKQSRTKRSRTKHRKTKHKKGRMTRKW